jgi:hypothetical protein
MKTTPLLSLMVISLVSISLIGPAAAGVFDQLEGVVREKEFSRETVRLSGFMSSPSYSLLEPRITKPNLTPYSGGGFAKTEMIQIDVPEKDLWRQIPTTGPNCPTCGFKNATYTFGAVFGEDYRSLLPEGFFFGGGGGAGAPGGGGCCG